jgi:hypothetical protein
VEEEAEQRGLSPGLLGRERLLVPDPDGVALREARARFRAECPEIASMFDALNTFREAPEEPPKLEPPKPKGRTKR